MNSDIECVIQQKFYCFNRNGNHYDSEYLSRRLERVPGINRMHIYAPKGTYEHLLVGLPIISQWIVFSSQPIDGSIRCHLSLFQRWVLSDISEDLYYSITDSLDIIRQADKTSIWGTGAGIAVPLEYITENAIRSVSKRQVYIKFSQVNIIEEFRCFIMAAKEDYGINIIWSNEWRYANQMKAWAEKLSHEYPWKPSFDFSGEFQGNNTT